MSVKYMAENYEKLQNKVYDVPAEIDKFVAELKIKTWGKSIDALSEEQKAYLAQ